MKQQANLIRAGQVIEPDAEKRLTAAVERDEAMSRSTPMDFNSSSAGATSS